MKKYIFRKWLIIILAVSIIGILPSLSGISVKKNMNNPINADILFFDTFNDNTKDLDKWTEVMSDGEWFEINERTEFKVHEYYDTSNQAILSEDITAIINTADKLTVSFQMITHIESNGGYVGEMSGQVKDKDGNGIAAEYRRGSNDFQILDSAGTDMTLFNADESSVPWDVTFEIYSDKYKVVCQGFDSGWIEKSIFSGTETFNFRFLAAATGDYPSLFWRCGFDEVNIMGKKAGRDRMIINSFLLDLLENFPLFHKVLIKI
jgi:hypothetical protein